MWETSTFNSVSLGYFYLNTHVYWNLGVCSSLVILNLLYDCRESKAHLVHKAKNKSSSSLKIHFHPKVTRSKQWQQHTCNDNYIFHALFHYILFVVHRETKAFLDHVDQKACMWVLFSKIQVKCKKGKKKSLYMTAWISDVFTHFTG